MNYAAFTSLYTQSDIATPTQLQLSFLCPAQRGFLLYGPTEVEMTLCLCVRFSLRPSRPGCRTGCTDGRTCTTPVSSRGGPAAICFCLGTASCFLPREDKQAQSNPRRGRSRLWAYPSPCTSVVSWCSKNSVYGAILLCLHVGKEQSVKDYAGKT